MTFLILSGVKNLLTQLQDLGFHIVWVFGWFIASVDWAVGFNGVRRVMNDVLSGLEGQFACTGASFVRNPDTFVQASIADVSTIP